MYKFLIKGIKLYKNKDNIQKPIVEYMMQNINEITELTIYINNATQIPTPNPDENQNNNNSNNEEDNSNDDIPDVILPSEGEESENDNSENEETNQD